jgi:hypothetical protein
MKRLNSHATVSGTGRFPCDMLRYDRCYPATEHDSNAIMDTFTRLVQGKWTIKLVKSTDGQWTDGRWASFGCTIIVES